MQDGEMHKIHIRLTDKVVTRYIYSPLDLGCNSIPMSTDRVVEELEIRQVALGEDKFYLATNSSSEWYVMIAKLATSLGRVIDAVQAGIKVHRYQGKEPAYIILSVSALHEVQTHALYQPAIRSTCGIDTYMGVPIAVVNTNNIIVEVK